MAGSWGSGPRQIPTEAGLGHGAVVLVFQMESLRGLWAPPSGVGGRLSSPPPASSQTCQSAQPCLMVEMKFQPLAVSDAQSPAETFI